MKKIISTKEAPKAIGPYSQAVMVGDIVFVSGQIPIDAKTSELVEQDIEKQTEKVIYNIKSILNEVGLDLENIIKTTVFLNNMDDFAKMNEVYGRYISSHYPARACVEVSRLPKDVLVEIEVIAHR